MADNSNAAALESKPKKTKKMTKEQEEEIKEFLRQFRSDSSPLMHVLSLHSYFFNKLAEDKSTLEDFLVQQRKRIEISQKDIEDAQAQIKPESNASDQKMEILDSTSKKNQEAADAKKEEEKVEEVAVEKKEEDAGEKEGKKQESQSKEVKVEEAEQEKAKGASAEKQKGPSEVDLKNDKAKKELDFKVKKMEDEKKLLKEVEAGVGQITEFSQEVKNFFANEDISMLVQQISRVLCIVQNTEMDIDECAKTLLNCAFDCFIPEMQEEVVRAQK